MSDKTVNLAVERVDALLRFLEDVGSDFRFDFLRLGAVAFVERFLFVRKRFVSGLLRVEFRLGFGQFQSLRGAVFVKRLLFLRVLFEK